MGKPSSTRGRSPQPPSEKQFVASPTLTVPDAGKARSKSRSRSRNKKDKSKKKDVSYKSDGVDDHDVFLLPVSDYWAVLVLTLVALVVRVYKIYQPSSVVFDEVQSVAPTWRREHILTDCIASVASRRNTSRASSSWTSTRPSPRCSSP